ncbi:phasin family protein [Micromonospora purpureochromogenes]|uniref:phasin family protein n=1 Tax=Micromonospora purpureochromogenes TaxID=47872 RepID=UPI003640831F
MQDAWRAYLELAMGLTEAPRKKAQDAARRLVGTGGATAAQLQALAEELVSTGAANREALTKLVRFEVDRALGAVGLATADEVAELTRRVHELERQLREAKGGPGGPLPGTSPVGVTPSGVAPTGAAGPATAGEAAGTTGAAPSAPPVPAPTKAVAKKAVAKKAIAKKPPASVSTTTGDVATSPARPVKKAAPRKRTTGGAE